MIHLYFAARKKNKKIIRLLISKILKTYFFKEVERLEFPEPIECNNIITNQKNKEDINSF